MERLGMDYDLVPCITPVDMTGGPTVGTRVSLKDCESVDLVVYKGVGTNAQPPVIDIQQANAATGGTAKDLDVIAHYFYKEEATLDGDETWGEVTQTAASEITVPSANTDEFEALMVFHIEAADLDFAGGYYWAFLTIADVANAQLVACLAVRTGLLVQRKPSNLRNPNA